MIRKITSIILTVIIASLFSVSCFAESPINGTMHTFTFSSGRTVDYYLDENNIPYTVENGERIYISLPLEHLKLQSGESDGENIGVSPCTTIGDPYKFNREPHKNLYSLKGGDEKKSNVYSADADFTDFVVFYSRDFDLNKKHNSLRIKTTNIKKPFFGTNKISFIYRYYEPNEKQWYALKISDVSCTGKSGYGVQHMPTEFPYGQVVVLIPKDITSCTVNIWTTLAY